MRKLFTLLSLLVLASLVLSACGGGAPAEPQTVIQTVIVEGTPQVVEVTVAPPMEERKPSCESISVLTLTS
jgi:ABC-type glycerol-3-phosphate transport system substrate-binding protein